MGRVNGASALNGVGVPVDSNVGVEVDLSGGRVQKGKQRFPGPSVVTPGPVSGLPE